MAYEPFGEEFDDEGDLEPLVGYQSDWTDPATGDVWMGARWYAPEYDTFLSRDNISEQLVTPISLNRYTYANDNPLDFIDPDGHKSKKHKKKKHKKKHGHSAKREKRRERKERKARARKERKKRERKQRKRRERKKRERKKREKREKRRERRRDRREGRGGRRGSRPESGGGRRVYRGHMGKSAGIGGNGDHCVRRNDCANLGVQEEWWTIKALGRLDIDEESLTIPLPVEIFGYRPSIDGSITTMTRTVRQRGIITEADGSFWATRKARVTVTVTTSGPGIYENGVYTGTLFDESHTRIQTQPLSGPRITGEARCPCPLLRSSDIGSRARAALGLR
jgi:RHS repeat-associated protein